MKAMRFGLVLVGAWALLLQVSCGGLFGDDSLPDDDGSSGYSGDLISALTLEAGSYRVTGAWNIEAALVLQPGTTLLFDAGASLTVSANGSISAVGTAQNPIVFNSSRTTKAAGDWEGVFIYANSSRFEYCEFSYAASALELNSKSNAVQHCTFTNNTIGLDASDNNATMTIASSSFIGNGTPFMAYSSYDIDDSNSFSGNTKQYISMWGDVSQNRSWTVTTVPLYFEYHFYIDDAALSLGAGTVLSFAQGRGLSVQGNGTLTATGTAIAPVTFTSARPVKAKGDWYGIDVSGTTNLAHVVIEYAESGVSLYDNGLLTISDSEIRQCDTGIDTNGWTYSDTNLDLVDNTQQTD